MAYFDVIKYSPLFICTLKIGAKGEPENAEKLSGEKWTTKKVGHGFGKVLVGGSQRASPFGNPSGRAPLVAKRLRGFVAL